MSDPRFARGAAGAFFRRADTRRDERASEAPRPLEDFLRNLAGWLPPASESSAAIRRLHTSVGAAALELQNMADEAVCCRFQSEIRSLRVGHSLSRDLQHLPSVLACVGEACRRRLAVVPHPVQLAGARAILGGRLVEMQTGEGKTLVAAIAATVMAATGAAVHVISTNDYLAQRDCEEMSQVFRFFGLTAGCIQGAMSDAQRRTAYANAICYASGKEVVFDYLKDRLAGHGTEPERVAHLREFISPSAAPRQVPLIPALHFAVVDEADSVMIDEARTPMILSREAPAMFGPELLDWAIRSARLMVPGQHFLIGAGRELRLLPAGLSCALPQPAKTATSWQSVAWREQLLHQALTALHLFHRDQHYILSEDKVVIVDESTGRVMPDRSWEQGLHQLIETKEQVPLSQGRETLARMTYQRFFRRYYLLSGLTGTATEASRELWSVYRLRVRRFPPNRPMCRRRLPDLCLNSVAAKWTAVADAVSHCSSRGQPVLVGTRSVQASEQVAVELARRDIRFVVLNARQDAEEAKVIARAGQAGQITVATNMAGRGTDIRPDPTAQLAGGLHVILTEFHESPRIDRQLFGRSARQGEPGTAQAIVSTQDPLFEHTSRALLGPAATRGVFARWLLRILVRRAQRLAERRAYAARLQTLRHDRELHRLIGFAGPVK